MRAKYQILLVDDDSWEEEYIGHVCQRVFGEAFNLDYCKKGSKAMSLLFESEYDLVLLDNNLSPAITAKFSVPFLKECSGNAKMAIISSNIYEDYLQDPDTLDVDYIIQKNKLEAFLQSLKTLLPTQHRVA